MESRRNVWWFEETFFENFEYILHLLHKNISGLLFYFYFLFYLVYFILRFAYFSLTVTFLQQRFRKNCQFKKKNRRIYQESIMLLPHYFKLPFWLTNVKKVNKYLNLVKTMLWQYFIIHYISLSKYRTSVKTYTFV